MAKKYSIYEYEHYLKCEYEHYVNHNIVMINDYLIPHNSSSSALEAIVTKCCK